LFYGIKPAVTAIVLQAAHRIGSRALKNNYLWSIAGVSFIAIFAFNVPFPLIVLLAAVVGYVGGRMSPATFQSGGHGAAKASYGKAFIDDDTPTPQHAQFKKSRFAMVVGAGILLWLIPMLALVAMYGAEHIYTQMSWFFTKAALLTFGGAYAVLPYVYQGAVDSFGWLSGAQMVDGLALGETTPGPLIMVVAFVAFVGAYLKAAALAMAPLSIFLMASAAACLVTWFTFLPSFIFILAGGPFIETTHNDLKFTAPLTAITAAVVGVILNLTLFFGYHVLWPKGLAGSFDWVSALMTIAAAIALFKYKRNVIHVIAVCALIGLAVKTFI
jgi:chromate transporter